IYISGGLIIIFMRIGYILPGILMIFKSAFNFKAAAGGFLGVGIMNAMQMGIARGISSNEAGLGSAPIAAAAAKTDVPGRQALISMSGVFLSSFIVCTITVLVLAVTNSVGQIGPNGEILNGAPLVMHAFSSVLPGGGIIVAIGLILFGLSTILGWSYYGEKCIEYILGDRSVKYYRFLFIIFVFLGSQLSIQTVWPLADIMNGLMAFPNLIGLIFLSKVVVEESDYFFKIVKKEKELQFDL
ncbi:MAG: alanine:cation symporter family protein, partial [Actinobacteria bacterium]|nr:alanine:cation symporter family protein [Actinomycetota bacterium]